MFNQLCSSIGWLHAEEWKWIHTYHPHKSELLMNPRPQYKIRYTEPDSIEVENNLNLIGARKDFLNLTIIIVSKNKI